MLANTVSVSVRLMHLPYSVGFAPSAGAGSRAKIAQTSCRLPLWRPKNYANISVNFFQIERTSANSEWQTRTNYYLCYFADQDTNVLLKGDSFAAPLSSAAAE